MAFLGHFGPLRLLWPVGRGLQANEAKRGQRGQQSSPQGQVGPKPQLDPPEPILATNPLDPNLAKKLFEHQFAINLVGPIFGHGLPWTIFPAMASGNHQRPPKQLSKNSPQLKGNSSFPPCIPY
ncbi:hypothetical protein O181_068437 [Austropuccinia psidii MF-1]|uniref:Uncharacterized protein n=1 Tax=Austropuccinia psidii MF-1 TaxID=1389203 RepID=A0A9Q3F2F9_9BASI|nr:hypothetical protein [Austropuccinia psidii MF-1]